MLRIVGCWNCPRRPTGCYPTRVEYNHAARFRPVRLHQGRTDQPPGRKPV